MEVKRAAAIAALCMLVMLSVSGQQQQQQEAAAMSEFCTCYQQCYPGCRNSLPRLLCVLKCADDCSPNKEDAAAAACRKACSLTSICGMSSVPADATGAAACVHDCNKKWSHNAKQL